MLLSGSALMKTTTRGTQPTAITGGSHCSIWAWFEYKYIRPALWITVAAKKNCDRRLPHALIWGVVRIGYQIQDIWSVGSSPYTLSQACHINGRKNRRILEIWSWVSWVCPIDRERNCCHAPVKCSTINVADIRWRFWKSHDAPFNKCKSTSINVRWREGSCCYQLCGGPRLSSRDHEISVGGFYLCRWIPEH